MLKVLKYLKNTWISVIAIVALLCVQAAADLALPDYTSKIVNIGIQQGGIDTAIPEAISKDEMDNLLIFTNDDSKILDCYKLVLKDTVSNDEYNNYLKEYPALENEEVYVLNKLNEDQKYNLEETGITDRNTWNKILEVYQTTIKNIPTSYKEYINEIYPGRFLSLGMSGDDVKVLQNFLFKICSKFHTIPGVRVTGTFDELTERSIKVLENRFNHEVNGIVGPVTWQKIVDYSKEEI